MNNSSREIAISQIAVFSTFALPIFLSLGWHGMPGFLGWGFLFSFCILRIVGGAIFLSDPGSEAGAIISSVAISPLILATMSIGYESTYDIQRKNLPRVLRSRMQTLLHILVTIGLTLSIVGALNFDLTDPSHTEHSAILKLRVGAGIFLAVWLILVAITAVSCRYHRRNRDEKTLLISVILVLPFLGARVVYAVLATAINSSQINIVSGNLTLRIILLVAPEMIVTGIFAVFGVVTRHVHN